MFKDKNKKTILSLICIIIIIIIIYYFNLYRVFELIIV
jgi:preprotein translocase subunit YajC